MLYEVITAWAITIHKSQGLTFEKAVIDANAAFAHGQVYVALSRCKTLEGMVLSSKLESAAVKSDVVVKGFVDEVSQHQPDAGVLTNARLEYERMLVVELFSFADIKRRMMQLLKLSVEHGSVINGNLQATMADVYKVFNVV